MWRRGVLPWCIIKGDRALCGGRSPRGTSFQPGMGLTAHDDDVHPPGGDSPAPWRMGDRPPPLQQGRPPPGQQPPPGDACMQQVAPPPLWRRPGGDRDVEMRVSPASACRP